MLFHDAFGSTRQGLWLGGPLVLLRQLLLLTRTIVLHRHALSQQHYIDFHTSVLDKSSEFITTGLQSSATGQAQRIFAAPPSWPLNYFYRCAGGANVGPRPGASRSPASASPLSNSTRSFISPPNHLERRRRTWSCRYYRAPSEETHRRYEHMWSPRGNMFISKKRGTTRRRGQGLSSLSVGLGRWELWGREGDNELWKRGLATSCPAHGQSSHDSSHRGAPAARRCTLAIRCCKPWGLRAS